MADSLSFSHKSPHPADAFWRVLGAFTEIDWLVGPGNYSVSEHEGRPARILKMDTPVIEFLLGCDEARRELRYGVLKNPFVPVDNYRATVTVQPDAQGCLVEFSATFDLDEVPLAQVTEMLNSGYGMIASRIDGSLGQEPAP